MPDALEQLLRLVAEGRLTADEAEPILAALERDVPWSAGPQDASPAGRRAEARGRPTGSPRFLRIVVTEAGRTVVNLRVPLALGRFAATRVPGLSDANAERIRRAIELGLSGPIVEAIDEDGSGARIVIE